MLKAALGISVLTHGLPESSAKRPAADSSRASAAIQVASQQPEVKSSKATSFAREIPAHCKDFLGIAANDCFTASLELRVVMSCLQWV
jgi:hypothetical protein